MRDYLDMPAEIVDLKAQYRQNSQDSNDDGDLGEWDAGEDNEPIPPRGWILGNTFCRRYLSCVQSGGGGGKTALRVTQGLAVASGKNLTGEHVFLRGRVLIVSLEDDRDELRRRVKAAMMHHAISAEEIKGWLYLASPGAKGWTLATIANGRVCPGALERKLSDTIKRRKIDLVILDPFVKAHGDEENANGQIDIVANILAKIGIENDCAIDAPHHISKGTADPGNADRGRGASSFKDAARLVQTLATMSDEEAKTLGVPEVERRQLIRMDGAKVNLAPITKATWFRLVGVKIGNASAMYPNGDDVQTIEQWSPPGLFDGLSHELLNEILTAIDTGTSDGRRYSNANAAGDRAAWRVVVSFTPEKTEEQAKEIIKRWVKSGLLTMQDYTDPVARKPAKGLVVNNAQRPA